MKSAKSTVPLTVVLACLCIAVLGLSLTSAEHHETTQATVDYSQDIRPYSCG